MYEFTSFPLWAFGLTLFVGLIGIIFPLLIMIPFEDKLGMLIAPFAAVIGVVFLGGSVLVGNALWKEDIVTDNPATINHLLQDDKSKILSEFNIDSDSLENLIAKEINASKVSVDDLDETKGLRSGHNSFTKKAAAGKLISFTAIKDGNSVKGTFYYEKDSLVIIVNSEVENVDEIVVPLD